MTLPNPLSSFKNWFIFLLLIAVVVLWFTRGCGSNPPAIVTENKATNDSVAKLLAIVQQSNIHEGLLEEDSIKSHAEITDTRSQLVKVQNLLSQSNQQTTALANEVSDAKIRKDSSAYISACDSLALVTKRDAYIRDSLQRRTKLALNATDKALATANEMKADLLTQKNGYKAAVALLQKTNANLAKALNPTTKVYIGLEGFTCPIASGVGPGIMLADKVGRVYRLAGGMTTTGNYWVGASAYIKIQLHK